MMPCKIFLVVNSWDIWPKHVSQNELQHRHGYISLWPEFSFQFCPFQPLRLLGIDHHPWQAAPRDTIYYFRPMISLFWPWVDDCHNFRSFSIAWLVSSPTFLMPYILNAGRDSQLNRFNILTEIGTLLPIFENGRAPLGEVPLLQGFDFEEVSVNEIFGMISDISDVNHATVVALNAETQLATISTQNKMIASSPVQQLTKSINSLSERITDYCPPASCINTRLSMDMNGLKAFFMIQAISLSSSSLSRLTS